MLTCRCPGNIRYVAIVFVFVGSIIVATWLYCVVFARHSAPIAPNRLNLMATVKPDVEFRLYRRKSENNHWDDGSPYPRTQALAILEAMATAQPWDRTSHIAVRGVYHNYPPGLTLDLTWCKDISDAAQRNTNSVAIHFGNWLFEYGNTTYQLSEEGHEALSRLFPKNGERQASASE